ncbi:hypothetical protein FRC12_014849 [Ceratobasidium sp. 428]|nr:hypothetical protein FRC12_014849 [Ceratobasidium sp. 428]
MSSPDNAGEATDLSLVDLLRRTLVEFSGHPVEQASPNPFVQSLVLDGGRSLDSMDDLAREYRDQGRWQEAETLEKELVDIKHRRLGSHHPDTLYSMSSLVEIYLRQARWDEAETLSQTLLEAKKQMLGERHSITVATLDQLARAYCGQERFRKAEVMGRKALEMREHALGEKHPDSLVSKASLAVTLRGLGRLREAENLMIAAVEGAKVFEPEGFMRPRLLGWEESLARIRLERQQRARNWSTFLNIVTFLILLYAIIWMFSTNCMRSLFT